MAKTRELAETGQCLTFNLGQEVFAFDVAKTREVQAAGEETAEAM